MKSYRIFIVPGVLLFIGLLAFIAALVSWLLFPDFYSTPARWVVLFFVALTGVVIVVKNLVDILKGVRDLLPEEQEKTPKTYQTPFSAFFYDCYCKAPGKPELSRAEFNQALWTYLDWVMRHYNQARLYTEKPPEGEQIPQRKLADIFIPLTLRLSTPPGADEIQENLPDQPGDEMDEHRAYLKAMHRRRRSGE
ncbi:MAG: hypothetical protein L0Z70_10635, partial [Chloroflexi bacterium]|nr:hypothetical protein [Chloroflexota bacterium]